MYFENLTGSYLCINLLMNRVFFAELVVVCVCLIVGEGGNAQVLIKTDLAVVIYLILKFDS